MSINTRVLEVRKYLNLSQQKFADSIDVIKQTIHAIEHDKYKPSTEVLIKIMSVYPGIDARWLMLGDGEMIRKDGKYTLNLNGKPNIGTFISGDHAQVNESVGKYGSDSNKIISELREELENERAEKKSIKDELDKAKDKIISLLEK